ncbi:MAG: hypothetical protein BWY93_00490 [Euryarchaeota archaeon ADurb.BinA087]|nr:MAG: hypothetical protein BWY93_00490 [Euryarchaeota archaeon ADurb.BinA087]
MILTTGKIPKRSSPTQPGRSWVLQERFLSTVSEESKSPDHITYLSSVTILSHDICRNRSPQS